MNRSPTGPRTRALVGSVWLWPAVLALLLGLYRIRTPELWRDEVSSWSASGRSLGRLVGMLGNVDASNGTYYLVLHLWTALFGESVTALRLPSTLAMAGAAAFTALLARRFFDSRVAGLAAGLLLAVVPNISAYAQEARTYALVTCLVVAGTWCLLRALERPGVGRWAWYGLCTALAGALHLVSLSSLAGQLVVVVVAARRPGGRRVLWQFPAAVAGALLPLVPLMLAGRQQSGRQLVWITVPGPDRLWTFWPELFGSRGVFYAFAALALLTLLRPAQWPAALQLGALAVLPVLGVWAVSHGGTSYFLDRYLLFTLPAWAALAGGGIGTVHALLLRAVPGRPAAVLALALAAGTALVGLPQQREVRFVTSHTETDFQGAAGLVAAGYRTGDGLAAVAGDNAWMMIGPGVTYYLPPGVHPVPLLIERTAVQADDLFAVPCPAPAECTGNVNRAWVVTIGTGDNPYQDFPADQARALATAFTPTEVRHVRALTVSLLVRRHP
ncbi:glycosyltransferase family 39 protein [Kitasatospora sp. MAP5-34]|uniref:glycosyltransferase family 39 protein n=1 Tax=Kitasatospora sp. MAP5-34 TaxID=3035102 RepID=UPI0024746A64|nr:glycosyltransferase family 39 protein [Kitasatospora sp. MAP5-34]MDH6577077.1 mannosyltransferase [Kitasatospora sp. MAP5-34]